MVTFSFINDLHSIRFLRIRMVLTELDISLLQDNLFEWHFSVRGPPDSDFDGGVYHGRIVLPPEYPMKPPSIILLTVRLRRRTRLTHIRLISPLKGNRNVSNQMIKEWKTGSMSSNPQLFLVGARKVTVVR